MAVSGATRTTYRGRGKPDSYGGRNPIAGTPTVYRGVGRPASYDRRNARGLVHRRFEGIGRFNVLARRLIFVTGIEAEAIADAAVAAKKTALYARDFTGVGALHALVRGARRAVATAEGIGAPAAAGSKLASVAVGATAEADASVATAYRATGIDFDTGNAYLTRGGGLTGAASGKLGIASFWANLQGTDGAIMFLLHGTGGGGLAIQRTAANRWNVRGRNSGGTNILLAQTNSTGFIASAGWHHILMTWDLGNGVVQIYADDVSDLQAGPTVTDDDINYDLADYAIGATVTPSNFMDSFLADVYVNFAATLDFSVEANRRKFRTSAGKPAFLGAHGELPTGTPPIVFLSGHVDSWHTNKGTGGGFTRTGTLGLADSPSD